MEKGTIDREFNPEYPPEGYERRQTLREHQRTTGDIHASTHRRDEKHVEIRHDSNESPIGRLRSLPMAPLLPRRRRLSQRVAPVAAPAYCSAAACSAAWKKKGRWRHVEYDCRARPHASNQSPATAGKRVGRPQEGIQTKKCGEGARRAKLGNVMAPTVPAQRRGNEHHNTRRQVGSVENNR